MMIIKMMNLLQKLGKLKKVLLNKLLNRMSYKKKNKNKNQYQLRRMKK